MEIEQAILKRKSIRKFKNKDIEEETIFELIESARQAPSAKNRQPWFFLTVKNNKKNKIANIMLEWRKKEESKEFLPNSVNVSATAIKEAPVLILVFREKDNNWLVGDCLSIGAAIQNIALTAVSKGLGTLWIRDVVYTKDEIANFVGYNNLELNSAIAVGVPNENPKRRPRKDITEIIRFLE